MTDLGRLDATALADRVRRGEISPAELVEAAITRIEKVNPELNAVIIPLYDQARAAAAGDLPDGPFRGVPTLLKDLDGALGGAPYHCGMAALKAAGYVAPHDDTNIARWKEAGFVPLGKTNTPELGLVPACEPLAYGPARNPWNPDRSTGGSSGGSGAAVAAGLVPAASAGDGGGSIRIPASENGIVGLKPTRGRVSVGPDLGENWSGLVVRGALTRTVRDAAAILDALSTPGVGDPNVAPPFTRPLRDVVGADPGRLRIGILTDVPGGDTTTDPECATAARRTGELLASLGHIVEESAPAALGEPELTGAFLPCFGSWTAAAIDGWSERIGRPLGPDDVEPGTWAVVELGRGTSGPQFVAALNWLHTWARRVVQWWAGGFDLLLTPTMPELPPRLGEFANQPDNPLAPAFRAAAVIPFVIPWNVTGQPAISLPMHWSAEGLPVGVQLVAGFGREDVLVQVAAQLEAAQPWADRIPTIHA